MAGSYIRGKFAKYLSFIMTLMLIISILTPLGVSIEKVYAGEALNTVLDETIEHYYKGKHQGVIGSWSELVALSAAKVDLKEYILPDTPIDGPNAVITALIKGDENTARNAAEGLVSDENLIASGAGAYGDAYNIIALEAYNRSASHKGFPSIKYAKKEAAADLIYCQEKDGGFGFGTGGDPDTTGIALIALSLYMEEEFSKDIGLDASIKSAIAFAKNTQQENGGYSNLWSGNNANSVAMMIAGLIAVEQDLNSMDWKTSAGKTPIDALLSFQVNGEGFGISNNESSDDIATTDAVFALANIVYGPYLKTFTIGDELLSGVRIQAIDFVGDYFEKDITVSENEGMTDFLVRLLALSSDDSVIKEYIFYVDGRRIGEDEINEYAVQDGDIILAVHSRYNSIAYFKPEGNSHVGVLEKTIDLGDSTDLSIVKIDLSTNESMALPAIPIDSNGDGYEDIFTDEEGKIIIKPITAITKLQIIKSSYDVIQGQMVTHLDENVAVLPAVIHMKAGTSQSCNVTIRIEGRDKNILYLPYFEAQNDGKSLLTVYDAVTQAMDNASVPYEGDLYISSVNGESGTESSGWMFLYNGNFSMQGMTQIAIEDDSEIILYHGTFSLIKPDIDTEIIEHGNLKITFTNYGTGIEGIRVYWNENPLSQLTNEEGFVIVGDPASGRYTMQIDKYEDGIPCILRMPPGYEIEIKDGGASGTTPSTPSDDVIKVFISVIGPEGVVLKNKTGYTYNKGMTALDLLRRTGLSIEYNNNSKTYVSAIEGHEEFDYGPTSGWLFKVNNDESILSSAAAYLMEGGDSLVWFYTKDFTQEVGSKKWNENHLSDETSESISKESLNNIIKDMESGKRDDWSMDLAKGSISFDREATESLVEQMGTDPLEISIEEAPSKNLNSKQKEAAGDRPVFDIKVISGKKNISQFGGKLTISLPYTLKAGEKPSGIVIYHLNDEGRLVPMEGYYDSVSKKVIFTVDHLSYYVIGYDEALAKWPFVDVKESDDENWYYSAVKYVYENGIFSGMSENTFEPNSPLTRSMLASLLARISGADLTKYTESGFKDVSIDSWYGPSVAWAKDVGVVSGYEKDGSYSFKPNDRITRQDIAVMLGNYNEKVGKKAYEKGDSTTFVDKDEISGYALSAVTEMQQAGIINGIKNANGSYNFRPSKNATRAEAATLIQNMLTK